MRFLVWVSSWGQAQAPTQSNRMEGVGCLGAQCLGGRVPVLAWDARPEGSGFVTEPNGLGPLATLASAALDPCDDTDLATKQKAAHWGGFRPIRKLLFLIENLWLRGQDLNLRPLGYEPNELPGCSTPRLSL
jgi:hypothetical protein